MRPEIRLLLVEDDDVQVVLFREMVKRLADMKICVEDVPTLAGAQSLLDRGEFDLVISDLNLLDSSGTQTLDGLLAHAGDLPVVVLSGAGADSMTGLALARGAQGFLSKQDVSGSELRRVMEQSILRKQYVDNVISGMSKDSLTGAWDRAAFTNLLTLAQKSGDKYAVLFFDVDHFKQINDSLGHRAGDEILVAVVDRIRDAIREGDSIGRWGGDEFAVIAPNIKSTDQLRRLCDRASKAVNDSLAIHGGQQVAVTVSCGAVLAVGTEPPQDVVDAADHAMYAAKVSGDHLPHFAMLNPAGKMKRRTDGSESAQLPVPRLLSDVEFWYQPMINVTTDEVWGYEALARWPKDEAGSTAHNLRRLLSSRAADKFAALSIERSSQALMSQLAPANPAAVISFNVHATQLENPGALRDAIESAAARPEFDYRRIQIELTDADQIVGNMAAIAMLWQLHERGVRVAIDDFCDHHSSFETILTFPVDAIKIDRTITSKLPVDEMASRIVRALVTLCADGSIELIAEGVETTEQRDLLTAAGVALQQGYLYGAPARALPSIASPRQGEVEDRMNSGIETISG